MSAFINGKLFIHIPKNMGRSIKHVISINNGISLSQPPHNTALQWKKTLGSFYDEIFTIAIVRNPWDWYVSYFSFKKGKKLIDNNVDFKSYLCSIFKDAAQVEYITDNNKIIVNRVFKFEEINDKWEEIQNLLGVQTDLPHINASQHEHRHKYYSPTMINQVAQKEELIIKKFGYTF